MALRVGVVDHKDVVLFAIWRDPEVNVLDDMSAANFANYLRGCVIEDKASPQYVSTAVSKSS